MSSLCQHGQVSASAWPETTGRGEVPLGRPGVRAAPLAGFGLAGTVLAWVTLVLLIDSTATLGQQRVLGLLTWGLLLALLHREVALVRVQTGVVVVFATVVEYTFSPVLEVYVYRFDNVPAYVPPGHGLVYLAALALGRCPFFQAHRAALVRATVLVGGAYALWGVTLAERSDTLGAFWYACLLGFLIWGRSATLYVGAFVVVTYLELVGTALDTWAWQPYDPTGLVSIGNPPSGAAGGYGWFDLVAVLLAPVLLRRRGGQPGPADHPPRTA